jgi:uncharacterized protein (TIGR00299 family) protein
MTVQKSNILYIDCRNSGISGDLLLTALLKIVPEPEDILAHLRELRHYLKGISELSLKLKQVKRNDINVNQLDISLEETKHHRTVNDLREALKKFIEEKGVGKKAEEYAREVLNCLVQGEAEVHGEFEEKLHLHELSSIDTLIDILGTTLCLEEIGVFKEGFEVYCSELPVGGGKVESAHGLIPVPAPVVVKVLEKSDLKVLHGPIQEELSTPTGVALLASLNPITEEKPFIIHKVSQSTGQKEFDSFLNILRVYSGSIEEKSRNKGLEKYNEKIAVLETNLDDVSGEIIGDFMGIMNKKHVLDVQILQGLTKKNRPSYIVKVLCDPQYKFDIIENIITHLGTLGVRYYTTDRICVEREMHQTAIELEGAEYSIHFKVSYYEVENERKIVNIKPEYDDLRRIREATGHSVKELSQMLQPKLNKIIKKKEK